MSAILVTGASSGIGRAIALQLIKDGHTVWGIARNEEKLKQVAADSVTDRFIYSVCDVSKTADMRSLYELMSSRAFEPDTLILNAGVTSDNAEINMQINFKGVVNCWDVFKAGFQKRGGIVAVSGSLFALAAAPFNLSYSQSKLDALNFIKSLASENENRNVRFNYFVLGPINTAPENKLAWWKALFIPSPEKTALYITKYLGSVRLINIFPLSSKVMILLNTMLPKVVMNRLITFLKR